MKQRFRLVNAIIIPHCEDREIRETFLIFEQLIFCTRIVILRYRTDFQIPKISNVSLVKPLFWWWTPNFWILKFIVWMEMGVSNFRFLLVKNPIVCDPREKS